MSKARTFVVIIIVQFVLMTLLLVYALVQRTNAIKNEDVAVRSQKLAEVVKVEAMQQAEMARARETAYKKELEACMTRK